jgi:hypothetical protein
MTSAEPPASRNARRRCSRRAGDVVQDDEGEALGGEVGGVVRAGRLEREHGAARCLEGGAEVKQLAGAALRVQKENRRGIGALEGDQADIVGGKLVRRVDADLPSRVAVGGVNVLELDGGPPGFGNLDGISGHLSAVNL